MEGVGRILTCTPSSWSQKSAAGGGAGRPQRRGGLCRAGKGLSMLRCAGLV